MARILIAEDERAINDLIMLNLELVGHKCSQVFDGEAALERALGENFDLVILDVMLPGLSGFEIIGKIVSSGGESADNKERENSDKGKKNNDTSTSGADEVKMQNSDEGDEIDRKSEDEFWNYRDEAENEGVGAKFGACDTSIKASSETTGDEEFRAGTRAIIKPKNDKGESQNDAGQNPGKDFAVDDEGDGWRTA